MRPLLLTLALAFVLTLTASASSRPLSVKEVFLMLRAGYSSATILHDLAQRQIVDAPDPTIQKSLGDFGASPELMQALTSGEYKVGAAEAQRVQAQEKMIAARQEEETEETFRNATEILKEQRARSAAAAPSFGASLVSGLQDKLVRLRDGALHPADASALASKKLIAFYFSAHWCAPCRKFTPELVDYYNRVAPQHPEFELIFVSYDRSRFNWETYLRDTKMPWLAIDYDQLGSFKKLKQAGGDAIPSLLVFDEQSRVVASSYAAGKYIGPQSALASLERIFATEKR